MTKKLFWENPYLTRLETHITHAVDNEVTVKETIFYAFSGGQERDQGTIASYQVLQARKDGEEIRYSLQADHSLKIGDKVIMEIDWERRYKLMRLHFAAEIVLKLVYKHLQPIEKIGAHISQDKSRIDFLTEENISKIFPILTKEANEIVTSDYPILSAFSDEEKERRYWEIKEVGKVPCGGTHLKSTGEVGTIKLKRKNIGKGKERIEITVH
jgi:Ser-tRNA(Ala) deacylase AlaX